MENNQGVKKKKKGGFAKVCSIVVDILVIPVIIIAFICTILTFSAKSNNKVPSIFGMSIVTVVSESMEPSFKKGDVLVIKNTNTNDLKVGDDIAFYAPLYLDSPYTTVIEGKEYSKVIFHKIVRIISDSDGKKYFVCMGTNVNFDFKNDNNFLPVENGQGDFSKNEDGKYVIDKDGNYRIDLIGISNDGNITESDIKNSDQVMQYVPMDMVVGVYDKGLSPTLGGIINFCASSTGMITVVIVPSVLLIGLTIVSLTKEVKKAKEEDEKERMVLEGNISKLKQTSSKVKSELKDEGKVEKVEKTKDKTDVQQVINRVSNTKNTSEGAIKKKPSAETTKQTLNITEKTTAGYVNVKPEEEKPAVTKAIPKRVPKKADSSSEIQNNSADVKPAVKKVPVKKAPPKQ